MTEPELEFAFTQMISNAHERPARADSHSIAPPPGTTAAPTSTWARTAFSVDAKRMSQASANSDPCARARPRNLATVSTRDRTSRVTKFGHAPGGGFELVVG